MRNSSRLALTATASAVVALAVVALAVVAFGRHAPAGVDPQALALDRPAAQMPDASRRGSSGSSVAIEPVNRDGAPGGFPPGGFRSEPGRDGAAPSYRRTEAAMARVRQTADPSTGSGSGPDTPEPATERGARAVGAVTLLGLVAGDDAVETRLIGFDAAAPRALVLWEVDEASGRTAPLGSTTSQAGGLVVADGLLLPVGGFSLVLAPVGSDPFGSLASGPVVVEPLPAEPPRAWLLSTDAVADGLALGVAIDGGGFTLVFGDADGREIERSDVPVQPISRQSARIHRLMVDAGVRRVARMSPDGHRSPWAWIETPSGAGVAGPLVREQSEQWSDR